MTKATRFKILSRLKVRYKEKYIDPLLFKFTRPPIMFDPDQVRLAKQLDHQMEELEKAELCECCQGVGTIIEKIPHVSKGGAGWNSGNVGAPVDSRAYSNEMCTNCLGSGIVLGGTDKSEMEARNGVYVTLKQRDSITCPTCHKLYVWSKEWDEDTNQVYFDAYCHKTFCKAVPSLLRLELTTE